MGPKEKTNKNKDSEKIEDIEKYIEGPRTPVKTDEDNMDAEDIMRLLINETEDNSDDEQSSDKDLDESKNEENENEKSNKDEKSSEKDIDDLDEMNTVDIDFCDENEKVDDSENEDDINKEKVSVKRKRKRF